MQTVAHYRYDDAWKAQVDKYGEDWRKYCLALHFVKKLAEEWRHYDYPTAWVHIEAELARFGANRRELERDIAVISRHEMQQIQQQIALTRH